MLRARDSEVLCLCLCSPGVVLKCVAGLRTVASGVFFAATRVVQTPSVEACRHNEERSGHPVTTAN